MPTPPDALKAARDAVEALPSHLFDRAHTDEIAENLAPDFARFAAQRGAEPMSKRPPSLSSYNAREAQFYDWGWSDGNISAKAARAGAPPQTGGGDALQDCSCIGSYCARSDLEYPQLGPCWEGVKCRHGHGPQTGGGDAPAYGDEISAEQIAALNRIVPDAAFADHETISGPAWGGGDAGERARELDDDVRRGGPEYFRAALKESRREGAEAMREACISEVRSWLATGERKTGLLTTMLRALPIPGKTDAG